MKIYLLLLALLCIQLVSSAQYIQQHELRSDNVTTRIHASYFFDPASVSYIKDGNDYQFYILYHSSLGSWNAVNTNNQISYCRLVVIFFPELSQSAIAIFNTTFTSDVENSKFFVSMKENEGITVDADCIFKNSSQRVLDSPVDFSIVSPTWECKECQKLEWSRIEVVLNKAATISDYTSTDLSYIQRLFVLVYELILILFWFLLIYILLGVIALFLLSVFWLYLYLQRLAKR